MSSSGSQSESVDGSSLPTRRAGIVSCDIVGHSREDVATQAARIVGLNETVAQALGAGPAGEILWASGGDGGHVLFLCEQRCEPALALALALRQWARDRQVPLRVTAHLGDVGVVAGADGRAQPVGPGINDAGALMLLGRDGAILASAPFRQAVLESGLEEVSFHDPRPVPVRGREQEVWLMSTDAMRSRWGDGVDEDRAQLRVFAESGRAWSALYHAKRVLQRNSKDHDVEVALRMLRPEQYAAASPSPGTQNSFLAHLDARSLRDIVRLGHLVERRYDESLCRYDEDGDTMFLILRGMVGVDNLSGDAGPSRGEPAFVLREGDVVGELSFALEGKRTADLTCLADSTLLAFALDDLSSGLARTPGGDEALRRLAAFTTSRIVEHVAHASPFLVGRDRSGPLGQTDIPWESMLDDLRSGCETTSWRPEDGPLSLETLDERDPRNSAGGVHVLVAGSLASTTTSEKRLVADEYPLVFVSLPGVSTPRHTWTVTSGAAKLLSIRGAGLDALPPDVYRQLHRALLGQLASTFYYDAFMSFNYGDETTVQRWRERLLDAGLKVYLDTPRPGIAFSSELEHALMDSLAVLAFVSPHSMVKPEPENWLRKEVAFREQAFSKPWIIPVRLRGGDPGQLLLRHTMVDATEREDKAIDEVIATLTEIRNGVADPPLPAETPSPPQLA